MKIVKFETADHAGVKHEYETRLFSCDESVALQLICSQPLINAVISAAATFVPALQDSGEEVSLQSLGSLLSKINWLTAPGILEPIPKMLEERGGPQLVAKIFANTHRLTLNKEAASAPTATEDYDPYIRMHLADPAMRDMAYGDGNYGEYWTAMALVLLVNFTRFGRDGSSDWRAALSTITSGLLRPTKEMLH